VKQSKKVAAAPEKQNSSSSRAIGAYFFFCSKKRDDATKCNFAQPVVKELVEKTKEKKAQANFFAKKRKS
jgi:hypothetical protein